VVSSLCTMISDELRRQADAFIELSGLRHDHLLSEILLDN